MRPATVENRIRAYLDERPSETAFVRREFDACGSRGGVDKALRRMVERGELVRLGYGVLARAKRNRMTGRVTIAKELRACAAEALRKLDVNYREDSATRAYNEGRTTQVPAWTAFDIGNSRLRRRLGYRKAKVRYERRFAGRTVVD